MRVFSNPFRRHQQISDSVVNEDSTSTGSEGVSAAPDAHPAAANANDNAKDTSSEDDGMRQINPVVRTYLYKADASSRKRFFLLFTAVCGSFMWWLGPVFGIFIVDPLITLTLLDQQVVTVESNCFDSRLANQTCDSDVFVEYYFYNITNQDEWVSGTAPPSYEQVGPFAFKAKEVRYNVAYDSNWTQVEYTYHQYAEFQPENSCPTCTLAANITTVNRGYLQFLSAPLSGPLDRETTLIYQLMPITLSVIRDSMTAYIAGFEPGSPSIAQDVVKQWTDCSFLLPLQPYLGIQEPYLKDVPLPPGTPGLPYNAELCAYIPIAMAQYNVTVTPPLFGAAGLAMDYGATGVFLTLAIGNSNSTYLDPNAAQFLGAFMNLPQATTLAILGSIYPEGAAALAPLTPAQWLLLQGYIASLVPTWGTMVYSGWLAAGGGGMIVTKSVDTLLYGFEDPILLAGAQAASAATGTPDAYKLTPWLYTPSLAVTFNTSLQPVEYFENVTGFPYNYSMLSWNSSDIGHFTPLVQQKRMFTGKGLNNTFQLMAQYRGLPFNNKTWGITNVTGIDEGVAFGIGFDVNEEKIAFDSALGRALAARYNGTRAKVKKVTVLNYNLTDTSTAACNMTYYAIWAGNTRFDPLLYQQSINTIPQTEYWNLMRNDTALSEYLVDTAPLHTTLAPYFSEPDVYRERCATPELFQGIWDMSGLLACPTIYTMGHFLGADPMVINSTGNDLSTWSPDPLQHGYSLGVEPFTGFAIEGHKTYQVNHIVTRTPNLYPALWVAPGSAAVSGFPQDFVTVPVYWIRMWWQPTDSLSSLIRIFVTASDVLYYLLVASWPVLGWVMLGSSLFILTRGKEGKERKRELPSIQETRARPVRITSHEVQMVAALSKIRRGVSGVVLPESIPEGSSCTTETANFLDYSDDVEHGRGGEEIRSAPDDEQHPRVTWKPYIPHSQPASASGTSSESESVSTSSTTPLAPRKDSNEKPFLSSSSSATTAAAQKHRHHNKDSTTASTSAVLFERQHTNPSGTGSEAPLLLSTDTDKN